MQERTLLCIPLYSCVFDRPCELTLWLCTVKATSGMDCLYKRASKFDSASQLDWAKDMRMLVSS